MKFIRNVVDPPPLAHKVCQMSIWALSELSISSHSQDQIKIKQVLNCSTNTKTTCSSHQLGPKVRLTVRT